MKLSHPLLLLALAFAFAPLAPAIAAEEKEKEKEKPAALAYDPAVSTLTGTLISMKIEDDDVPALKGQTVWIFQPDKPISVKANPDNEVDEAEADVKDVQLALGEKTVDAATLAKYVAGKTRLTVKGKLFHGHTAHHVTKVLLSVTELKPIEAEPAKKK